MKFVILSSDFRGSDEVIFGRRDTPSEPNDTGWQFWVEGKKSQTSEAQVWSMDEFCREYPSFRPFTDMPEGSTLKYSKAESWREYRG